MGTQIILPKKGRSSPIFGPCLLWPNRGMDQLKMTLGMAVGLGPGHIVLDVDPPPLPQKGPSVSQFSAHVYCGQNGWMDQDATWYGHRLRPRQHSLRWRPSSPQKGGTSPNFRPMSLVAKRLYLSGVLVRKYRPQPRQHCVGWGPSSPSPKVAHHFNFRPMSVVAKWLDGLICHLVWR